MDSSSLLKLKYFLWQIRNARFRGIATNRREVSQIVLSNICSKDVYRCLFLHNEFLAEIISDITVSEVPNSDKTSSFVLVSYTPNSDTSIFNEIIFDEPILDSKSDSLNHFPKYSNPEIIQLNTSYNWVFLSLFQVVHKRPGSLPGLLKPHNEKGLQVLHSKSKGNRIN